MSFRSLLVQTAKVQRPTDTSDDAGGITKTWATVATVPCRLEQLSSTEDLPPNVEATHRGFFLPDTELRATGRVLVDGATYAVVGQPAVFLGRSGPHHIEALLLTTKEV